MKQLIVLLFSISILFASCKKGDDGATGPAGPAGPAGPQGPTGIAGNANVTQYTFAGNDFAANQTLTLQINTTADTTSRSTFYVYLVRSGAQALTYPIPGFGYGALSDYRMYWGSTTSKITFFLNKVSGAGEEYASIRVIRLYASNVLTGGKFLEPQPDIDFNDYYAVCKYYNLPTR